MGKPNFTGENLNPKDLKVGDEVVVEHYGGIRRDTTVVIVTTDEVVVLRKENGNLLTCNLYTGSDTFWSVHGGDYKLVSVVKPTITITKKPWWVVWKDLDTGEYEANSASSAYAWDLGCHHPSKDSKIVAVINDVSPDGYEEGTDHRGEI